MGYNQGWYNNTPPPQIAAPNFSVPPPGMQGGAPGAPVRFNLPNKKLGFNNALQNNKQNKPNEQMYNQNNMGGKNKKNKQKQMLMSNNPWMNHMNQPPKMEPEPKKEEPMAQSFGPQPVADKSAITQSKSMTGMVASGDWPESLKKYVSKCFKQCVSELDKDQVE